MVTTPAKVDVRDGRPGRGRSTQRAKPLRPRHRKSKRSKPGRAVDRAGAAQKCPNASYWAADAKKLFQGVFRPAKKIASAPEEAHPSDERLAETSRNHTADYHCVLDNENAVPSPHRMHQAAARKRRCLCQDV